MFESVLAVICQCQPPCFMPFQESPGAGEWYGCTLPAKHEGWPNEGHSLAGPGVVTYRDDPMRVGPRLRLKAADWHTHADLFPPSEDGAAETREGVSMLLTATCHRCGREYVVCVQSRAGEGAAAPWEGPLPEGVSLLGVQPQ